MASDTEFEGLSRMSVAPPVEPPVHHALRCPGGFFYLRFAVPALSSSSFGFDAPPDRAPTVVLFVFELVVEPGAEPSLSEEL